MADARGDGVSNDLRALETWAGALLAKLQPAQRRAINHQVAIDLRRSQAQRIKAQQGPDGAAYPPRKWRKELKGKKGRIKRQKAAMFAKIRTAKHLKVKATGDQIEVGFFGRVARIARIHQEGLEERNLTNGRRYRYPSRKLLGVGKMHINTVRHSLLYHLALLNPPH